MTARIQITTDVIVMHCIKCGVIFGITAGFEQERRRSHENFWCPNGHAQCFTAPKDKPLPQRQEEIRKLHDAEQAEAKAAEAKEAAATPAALADSRMQCPTCGQYFNSLKWFNRHVRKHTANA